MTDHEPEPTEVATGDGIRQIPARIRVVEPAAVADARNALLTAIGAEARAVTEKSAGQASAALVELARAYALMTAERRGPGPGRQWSTWTMAGPMTRRPRRGRGPAPSPCSRCRRGTPTRSGPDVDASLVPARPDGPPLHGRAPHGPALPGPTRRPVRTRDLADRKSAPNLHSCNYRRIRLEP